MSRRHLRPWFWALLCLPLLGLTFLQCSINVQPPSGLLKTTASGGPKVLFDLDAKPLPEIPLPNDLATRLDPTSPTGRRINVSMISPTHLESTVRTKINRLHGFGVYSPITVQFDKPLELGDIIKRHQKNDDFSDDVAYLVCLDKRSPHYGRPVLLDMGRGNFPILLKKASNYFDFDYHAGELNILFETKNEPDTNKNGKLDPAEDLDHDGHRDEPNVYPKGADPKNGLIGFYERETKTLILQPVVPLSPESTYAVILTKRLKGEDGKAIQSPFDGINHTRQTEALRPLVSEGILKKIGIEQKDIAFAWTFTTQSTSRDMKEIRDGMYGQGPYKRLLQDYPNVLTRVHQLKDDGDKVWMVTGSKLVDTLKSVGQIVLGGSVKKQQALLDSLYNIDYIVSGEFNTPYFLAPRDKDGNVVDLKTLDPAKRKDIIMDNKATFLIDRTTGKMTVGKDSVFWWCAIPKATEKFKPPFPVSFYGHGYTSSRFEMVGFAGTHARLGIATCGIDAVGHGAVLSPSETRTLEAIMGNAGLIGVFRALSPARARDLNNDGYADSGGDFWTADMFHTRDVVRQSVIDHMKLIQIMRTWDGKTKWNGGKGFDISGDGKAVLSGIAGDFNGDGKVDIGGPTNDYHAWGQSLGGFLSSILAAVEPAITAAAPVSGGAGLLQLAARSTQGGVVEAVFLRTMGPILIGYGQKDGSMELRFWTTDVNKRACSLTKEEAQNNPSRNCQFASKNQRVDGVRIAVSTKIQEGDKIVFRNMRSKEEGWALARKDPKSGQLFLRIALPCDALDALEKRSLLGITSDPAKILEPGYKPPEVTGVDGKTDKLRVIGTDKEIPLLGDPLVITVYEGTTDKVRETINTFGNDVYFQGAIYKKGAPLFAIAEGFALRRQTPEFRRFSGFAGMIVSPGDPVAYAQHFHLNPLLYSNEKRLEPGANVLVIPTLGDMNVPVDTGIAIARAAGILPVLTPDMRYPDPQNKGKYLTANQVLIRNFVVEGVDIHKRFTHPKTGIGILFDPDNLSNGTDGYGAPRLNPPLRLSVPTRTGVAGLRLPYIRPSGDHGFDTPDPELPFDINTFMANQIAIYFRSRGTEIRDHICLENSTCPDFPQKPSE